MTLEVDLRSLQRFWNPNGGVLAFQVTGMTAPTPAVAYLKAEADEIELPRQRQGSNSAKITVDSWLSIKAGVSAVLWVAHDMDHALAWLERFSTVFGSGAVGKIGGGPRAAHHLPQSSGDLLSLFVAYTTTSLVDLDLRHRGHWNVPPKITDYLTGQAVNWAYTPDCEVALTRFGQTIRASGHDAGQAMSVALEKGVNGSQFFAMRQKPEFRKGASFEGAGKSMFQLRDPDLGWEETVAELRNVMLWTPPHTDCAFIRLNGGNADWFNPTPRWPHLSEAQVRYTRPLLSQFVPDAHGLQLLTSEHLARANDLSSWRITNLPGGRHLVEAQDLEPWFAYPTPERRTLEDARADFGNMILTPKLALENYPWPPGDGWHTSIQQLLTS